VTGHLYVVWQDGRFRSDGMNDIVMSISTDAGASWGAVAVVSDSRRRQTNHFTPAVAVYGGMAVVTYVTRKDESDKVRMAYVVSDDGGLTFGREHRLGGVGDIDFAATGNGLRFLGDYMGVAMSVDAAHAVWCRPSRPFGAAKQHQTTWSATIPR
jgi:hypothetical protein